MVFEMSCHIPIGLEPKALWALNELNLNWGDTLKGKVSKLHEVEEFYHRAYESSIFI